MNASRAAVYVRVSTDKQTTANQLLALEQVAARRGWVITKVYSDNGISGAVGRDKRPAFDLLMKDAIRGRYDVLLVWSIDRLGRSVVHVSRAMADLAAAGVALYADKQGIDSTSPTGRAMLQLAVVFGELERDLIRERVLAGLDRVRKEGRRLGRPTVLGTVETSVRAHLEQGMGMNKVARLVGVGNGTVQRIKAAMQAVPV